MEQTQYQEKKGKGKGIITATLMAATLGGYMLLKGPVTRTYQNVSSSYAVAAVEHLPKDKQISALEKMVKNAKPEVRAEIVEEAFKSLSLEEQKKLYESTGHVVQEQKIKNASGLPKLYYGAIEGIKNGYKSVKGWIAGDKK
jgi:hypothetical protein